MKQNQVFLFLIILFLVGLLSSSIFATDVVGTVTETNTGLLLSSVVVKIIETGDSTMTDINGNYFIPNVVDGSYTLLVGGLNYTPLVFSRTIGSCCIGVRGNIDNDLGDQVDISDLVYLVDFIFTRGPSPVCLEESNVDGDVGGFIDISDLVYLVDFIFTSGADPASCF